ncbi:unnamed protein product, partial [Urochloa humidicola]
RRLIRRCAYLKYVEARLGDRTLATDEILRDGFCLNMLDTPLCPLKVVTNLQEAGRDEAAHAREGCVQHAELGRRGGRARRPASAQSSAAREAERVKLGQRVELGGERGRPARERGAAAVREGWIRCYR